MDSEQSGKKSQCHFTTGFVARETRSFFLNITSFGSNLGPRREDTLWSSPSNKALRLFSQVKTKHSDWHHFPRESPEVTGCHTTEEIRSQRQIISPRPPSSPGPAERLPTRPSQPQASTWFQVMGREGGGAAGMQVPRAGPGPLTGAAGSTRDAEGSHAPCVSRPVHPGSVCTHESTLEHFSFGRGRWGGGSAHVQGGARCGRELIGVKH